MSVHWFYYGSSPLPLATVALPMLCMSQSVRLLTFKFAGTSRPHLNLQLRGLRRAPPSHSFCEKVMKRSAQSAARSSSLSA